MKNHKIFLTIICCLALMLSGCGGGEEARSTDSSDPTTETPQEQPMPAEKEMEVQGPDEMAAIAHEKYESGLDQVASVVMENDDPEIVRAQLSELKDAMIEDFVSMGETIATWDEAQVKAYQSALLMKIRNTDMTIFQQYADSQKKFVGNKEVTDLIRDFNIITQYSQFELLKEQEPEEAARLGIQ